MIKCIAAIDDKRGLANDQGIPWFGKIPGDTAQFRQKTLHSTVVMGFRTYQELAEPLGDRRNLVLVRPGTELRPGFEVIEDIKGFLEQSHNDIWIVGGASIYAQLLPYSDQLYLTRVHGDFGCTKFFPEFTSAFQKIEQTPEQTENGINFHFEVWEPKQRS